MCNEGLFLCRNTYRVIPTRLHDRVRQPPARAHSPEQYVHERVAALLAGQARKQHGTHVRVRDPRLEEHGPHGVEHDDRVGARGGGGGDERVAGVPEREVVPVASVRVDGDVALARVGVGEREAGVRLRGDGGYLGVVEVGEDALDDGSWVCAVDEGLDGGERVDEVGELRGGGLGREGREETGDAGMGAYVGGAGAPSHGERALVTSAAVTPRAPSASLARRRDPRLTRCTRSGHPGSAPHPTPRSRALRDKKSVQEAFMQQRAAQTHA